MLLNFQTSQAPEELSTKPALVFIHGLFGSLSNLGMLAREFMQTHQVIQLDLRNHGQSPHHTAMNYSLMAEDVLETLDQLNIKKFSVVGHSMGGKVAMSLIQIAEQRIDRMAILDMAPYTYQESHHDHIFTALLAVQHAKVETRQQATEIMREYLKEEMVIQFLMKSFNKGQWLFNVAALQQNYANILSWNAVQNTTTKPILFLRGAVSPYIQQPEHFAAIQHQFPNAQIHAIENAGHWLHAQKTADVLEQLKAYFI